MVRFSEVTYSYEAAPVLGPCRRGPDPNLQPLGPDCTPRIFPAAPLLPHKHTLCLSVSLSLSLPGLAERKEANSYGSPSALGLSGSGSLSRGGPGFRRAGWALGPEVGERIDTRAFSVRAPREEGGGRRQSAESLESAWVSSGSGSGLDELSVEECRILKTSL